MEKQKADLNNSSFILPFRKRHALRGESHFPGKGNESGSEHLEKHHRVCDELIQGLLRPELSWSGSEG
jgi:hypothetical protein